MVRSHIQMPKLIMKNFTDANNQLYFFDIEASVIKRGYAKSLYTELGYYSDEIENYLGKRIEGKLGELIKLLNMLDCHNSNQTISSNYEEIVFDYLYSLLTRSPKFQNQIKCHSIFFQFFRDQFQHDYAAFAGMEYAKENSLLRELKSSFLINNTSREFVLPTGGITIFGDIIICPVSPKRAITFCKNSKKDDESKNNVVTVDVVDEENIIDSINRLSVIQESERDKKYIISSQREYLEILVRDIKG